MNNKKQHISDELTETLELSKFAIDSRKLTVDECIHRLEKKTLVLNTDSNRKKDWSIEKQSKLIESLMVGFPIPMFYVAADMLYNFTIIDGFQRMRAISNFIIGDDFLERKLILEENKMRLKGLKYKKDWEGKTFEELPVFLQRKINETKLSFTIINPGTPDEILRDIFERINTGGRQQIRNILYKGAATELANKLLGTDIFKKVTKGLKYDRLRLEEIIWRFIAFSTLNYEDYCFQTEDVLISNTMKNLNLIAPKRSEGLKEIEERFCIGLGRTDKIFGENCFREPKSETRRGAFKKTVFEVVGILLSNISDAEFSRLQGNKNSFIKGYNILFDDKELTKAIGENSMSKKLVSLRYKMFSDLINKYTK